MWMSVSLPPMAGVAAVGRVAQIFAQPGSRMEAGEILADVVIDLSGGVTVTRSGLRWLRGDGYRCRAGEIVAYCNIGFDGEGAAEAFAGEAFDLQVALAPRVGGRIRQAPRLSQGGYLDRLAVHPWRA